MRESQKGIGLKKQLTIFLTVFLLMGTADLLQAQTEEKEPTTEASDSSNPSSEEALEKALEAEIAPEPSEAPTSMALPPLAALAVGYDGEIYGCDKNAVPKVLPFFCRLERKMDTHFKKFDVRIRLK